MATIKDLARELELSPSVVSRALNPHPDANARVAPETRQRVEEAAARLGYRRNRIAEFMQRGKAATFGVFIPDFSNRLVADLMFGISEQAAEYGFPLNFYPGMSEEAYRRFISGNLANPCSGIISYPYRIDESALLRELLVSYQAGGGKVLLLNTVGSATVPALAMDEEAGGRLAAEALLAHGCAAYLVNDNFPARRKGFVAALRQAGSERPVATFSRDEAEAALRKAAADYGCPLGVFSVTDADAMAFLSLFRHLGLSVGREVFLIGYDDLALTALTDPPLTTIHQPFREQGRRAVEKLVSLIYGHREESELIAPRLVRRLSA